MGQYYWIVNVDKKEFISQFDGSKLMEIAWLHGRTAKAVTAMMLEKWKGDRVYVVGDYAGLPKEGEVEECWQPTLRKVLDWFDLLKEDSPSLYAYVENHFKDVTKMAVEAARWMELAGEPRYIVNRKKGVYVDLRHVPTESVEVVNNGSEIVCMSVHPLLLLLAMGNGLGGGDYAGSNDEAVGLWVEDSRHLELWGAERAGELRMMPEYCPDFAETKEPIAWQDKAKAIAEAWEKYSR